MVKLAVSFRKRRGLRSVVPVMFAGSPLWVVSQNWPVRLSVESVSE